MSISFAQNDQSPFKTDESSLFAEPSNAKSKLAEEEGIESVKKFADTADDDDWGDVDTSKLPK